VFAQVTILTLNELTVTNAIGAIAALGTAAFGLVDATKVFDGGVSRCGFGKIKGVIRPFFGNNANEYAQATSPTDFGPMLNTLRANWLNGNDLNSQKAIAKSLLKLRLNADNAANYAAATGMNEGVLATIAGKISRAESLSSTEMDAFGRFDLTLTALLDEGYQRADQIYRNSCKFLAVVFSVALAVFGGYILHDSAVQSVTTAAGNAAATALTNAATATAALPYWGSPNMWKAVVIGLLATPLAPIAKDLSSAIIAGVQAVQSVGK
jgi:hypothetical protein